MKFILTLLLLLAFASNTSEGSNNEAKKLSKSEAQTIINSIGELIENHYVFVERRRPIVARFNAEIAANPIRDDIELSEFTEEITSILREVSNDGHLYVRSLEATKNNKTWEQEERGLEDSTNYGFREIAILDGNVGYIKITEFMHPQRAYSTAQSAMEFLNKADAMIVDLRGNPGGYGGIAELFVSWFFDPHPTHLMTTIFSDPQEAPYKLFTLPFVPTERKSGVPTFVLIDNGTASAAEFVAYTLQAFSKATIVGSKSAGAAHRNSYFPIIHDLRLSISTGAPMNPITKTNWENSGVIPDVEIDPSRSKEHALELAREALSTSE